MDGEDEPRPGNWDRAWNDPPLFSYKSDSKPPAAGLKLNKRVHHPVESAPPPISGNGGIVASGPPRLHDAGAKSVDPSNLPPPPASNPGAASLGNSSAKKSGGSSNVTDQVVTEEDRGKAVETIRALHQSLETKIDSRKFQDIKKRLDTMESKWQDGSLTYPVERSLVMLAIHLESSNYDEADKLQRKLMVDWPSLCGTWLVGIKHLIFESNRIKES